MQNFIVVLKRSPLLPSTDGSRIEVKLIILNIMSSSKLVMERVGLQSNKQTNKSNAGQYSCDGENDAAIGGRKSAFLVVKC